MSILFARERSVRGLVARPSEMDVDAPTNTRTAAEPSSQLQHSSHKLERVRGLRCRERIETDRRGGAGPPVPKSSAAAIADYSCGQYQVADTIATTARTACILATSTATRPATAPTIAVG